MLHHLKKLWPQKTPPVTRENRMRELQLAAAALLTEAAQIDGTYDESERLSIVSIAQRYFGFDEQSAIAFAAEAKRRADKAVDLFGFTQYLVQNFADDERRQLLQMLWEVVLADNHIDEYQASLMRRVTGLLGLMDRDSADARQTVIGKNKN